jgi:hypothetical protein
MEIRWQTIRTQPFNPRPDFDSILPSQLSAPNTCRQFGSKSLAAANLKAAHTENRVSSRSLAAIGDPDCGPLCRETKSQKKKPMIVSLTHLICDPLLIEFE